MAHDLSFGLNIKFVSSYVTYLHTSFAKFSCKHSEEGGTYQISQNFSDLVLEQQLWPAVMVADF